MTDFFMNNASAVFGLAGALIGGILSFIASWMIMNREYTLSIWKILLERRINAHENVITVALEMRVMIPIGGIEKNGEVARSPQLLMSREVFDEWFNRYTMLTKEGSAWLSIKAKKEVNFVQDYLVTLHTNLANVPNERFLAIGQVIRQDFIDLSSTLEKVAYDFFEKQIRKKTLDSLNNWHKYPRELTESRLADTVLLSNRDLVNEIANKLPE